MKLDQMDSEADPAALDIGLQAAARASACFAEICVDEGIDIATFPGGTNNTVLPSVLYALRPAVFIRNHLALDPAPGLPEDNEERVVVISEKSGDKFSKLDRAIKNGDLWAELEKMCEEKGKSPGDLRILIKPNISMCVRREDDGVYSDPELVLHLIARLMEQGYSRVTVGESRNLYGNWYNNREVIRVAAYAGFLPDRGEETDLSAIEAGHESDGMVFAGNTKRTFRMVDLSGKRFDREFGNLGKWELSEEWVHADFRINFCKAKTHFFSFLTLCTKNLYGALPSQNKMVEYHGKQVTGSLTAEMLIRYPAHFHIVDANTVSDGILGAKMSAVSKKPKCIIAGRNLVCVEAITSLLLGINPRASFYFREAHRRVGGLKSVRIIGEAVPISRFRNIPSFVIHLCRGMEKIVRFATLIGYVFNGQVDRAFPSRSPVMQPLAKLLCIFPYPMLAITNWDMIKIYRARIAHRIFCLKHKTVLPLSVGKKMVAGELRNLGPPQLTVLLELLEKGDGVPVRMGSWVERGQVIKQVVSVTQSSSRAVVRLLHLVHIKVVDADALTREIRELLKLYETGRLAGRADFFARQNND